MKKLLCIFCIGITLVSCEPNENKTNDNITKECVPWSSVTEYTYKGHDYIKFKEFEGYDGYAGVVHNPDCKCFKNGKQN